MTTRTKAKIEADEWEHVGDIYPGGGRTLVLCDPDNAEDEVLELWRNETAGPATLAICPTGYEEERFCRVHVRYEPAAMGERIAEVRIVFLPHRQLTP